MNRTSSFKLLFILTSTIIFSGCAGSLPKLKTAEKVDLQRFMGPWYVIAAIPTLIETKSYNAIESYELLSDGTIQTTFAFNQGSFDGPKKIYRPKGFIVDKVNNSTWRMQFIWPFKAEYLIIDLDPEYTQTVIGRNKRDYFWIMARTPKIPEEDYNRLLNSLKERGYDITKVRKVPQQ